MKQYEKQRTFYDKLKSVTKLNMKINKILIRLILIIFGAFFTAALVIGAVFFSREIKEQIKNLAFRADFSFEVTNPKLADLSLSPPAAPETPPPMPKQEYKIQISNSSLEQSDILIIKIEGSSLKSGTADFNGHKLELALIGNRLFGFMGIAPKTPEGRYPLQIKIDNEKDFNYEIAVLKRKFPITKLILPQKLIEQGVTPAELAQNIISTEKPTLDAILAKITPKAYFTAKFQEPIKKWIDVGAYGNIRKSGDTQIQHLGVDLEGNLNDPVYASNDGMVRFAGELADFGNIVIIDHGAGIFTLYLHLSKIFASQDKPVKKSELIGEVGSSGEYSLGAHLHFSIKVNGASVDPKRFLETVNEFLE